MAISKPKKKRNQTIGYWQRKADKRFQEIGRKMYEEAGCIRCDNDYSCLHHFFPKSQSTYLRYNWKNAIPLCAGCHHKHHNGDPTIHADIIYIKGEKWFIDLVAIRNNHRYIKAGYTYYRDMFERLGKLEPYKVK